MRCVHISVSFCLFLNNVRLRRKPQACSLSPSLLHKEGLLRPDSRMGTDIPTAQFDLVSTGGERNVFLLNVFACNIIRT